MAQYISDLVVVAGVGEQLGQDTRTQLDSLGVRVHEFDELCMPDSSDTKLVTSPDENHIYIMSYTSGTTGDPKGVKLSHKNVLSSCKCVLPKMKSYPGDTIISYLPYTHSFEQILFSFTMLTQMQIGYWVGDPLRLVEDVGKLRPHIFPSVPRIYNRIYAKL